MLWRLIIISCRCYILIVHLQLIWQCHLIARCGITAAWRTASMFLSHNIVCNWFAAMATASVACCKPWRSPLQNLFPYRFLPNPVPAKHSGQGIVTSNADNAPIFFLPLYASLLNSMVQNEKMGESIISSLHIWFVLSIRRATSISGAMSILRALRIKY